MSYYHLTINDRKSIDRLFHQGEKISAIARLLGVHRSTIYRELKRNPSRDHGYNAVGADRKAKKRRKNSVNKPRLVTDKEMHALVEKGLGDFWSPEEISNRLPKKHRVCTTTIYRAIKRNLLPKGLEKNLRHYGKKFKNKNSKPVNITNSELKNIKTRPSHVNKRNRFGHWELDTIVLRQECACHLATLVERKGKTALIRKIPDKKAATMAQTIIAALKDLPLSKRRTITVDNGMEFSDWKTIEAGLPGTKVYYCDPRSPWQRGLNENTNGLIRQFFPRKKLLPPITDEYVAIIQNLLNNRPRKSLNWKSPNQVFCCT